MHAGIWHATGRRSRGRMARLQHWADAFDHRLSDSDPSFFLGESNHMSNVETLIDSTMWLCDIETLRSLGTETNEDVYICHVCSMSFLLMFWPPMFRWFHPERSCYFPPRTIWRDFPPKTTRPYCGNLDGKGMDQRRYSDVRRMVSVVHKTAPHISH